MQKRHQKVQKALCRYVYAQLTHELRPDAAGIGIYGFHVLLEAFLRARPGLRSVRRPAIERVHGSIVGDGHHGDSVAASPEPHALQYVYDILFDPEPDEVALTAHERSLCWHVLHTVVVCLHEARVR